MGLLNRFKKENVKDTAKKDDKAVKVSDPKKKVSKLTAKKEVGKKVSKPAEKKAKAPQKEQSFKKKKEGGTAPGIILYPLISEKSVQLSMEDQYVFAVATSAGRVAVKMAIRDLYGVMPTKVRLMNVKGKAVRMGRKRGKRKDWKKAIVSLPKGTRLEIYEGV